MREDWSEGQKELKSTYASSKKDLLYAPHPTATTLKPNGGTRVIGSVLSGAALDAIERGTEYYGDTTITGKPFIALYAPIRGIESDAYKRGESFGEETIGAYYVGHPK